MKKTRNKFLLQRTLAAWLFVLSMYILVSIGLYFDKILFRGFSKDIWIVFSHFWTFLAPFFPSFQ